MPGSAVAQWASSEPLQKVKCTLDVYSRDEFIPSQALDVHLPNKEGGLPISAGRRGRRVEIIVDQSA